MTPKHYKKLVKGIEEREAIYRAEARITKEAVMDYARIEKLMPYLQRSARIVDFLLNTAGIPRNKFKDPQDMDMWVAVELKNMMEAKPEQEVEIDPEDLTWRRLAGIRIDKNCYIKYKEYTPSKEADYVGMLTIERAVSPTEKTFTSVILSLKGDVLAIAGPGAPLFKMEEDALIEAGVLPKNPERQCSTLSSIGNVMGGDICIKGTRITAASILRLMDRGKTDCDILHSYPSITKETVEVLRKLHQDYVLQINCQAEPLET